MMFLDILFPNRCLSCNSIITEAELVCVACWAQLKFTHWDFGENHLKQKAEFLFPVEKAFALLKYEKEGLTKKIIHQLKYRNQEKVGGILAEWVAERIDLGEEKIDMMAGVPLHPKKLRKRGYNQLELFGQTLSKKWNIPYRGDLLSRNTYHKAQATKDKTHREDTKYDFSFTEKVEQKHILLIDDVFTTGSTLSAIAWEILKHQGNKISILVMAVEE